MLDRFEGKLRRICATNFTNNLGFLNFLKSFFYRFLEFLCMDRSVAKLRVELIKCFDISLTVYLSITLANGQLVAQMLIHLLQSSTCTCFEQYLAHPQVVKLY